MTKKRSSPKDYNRTTYRLGCVYSSNPAKLDFRARLGLDWAERWVQAHGGLKAPHSGLIRRAIHLYLRHLQGLESHEARHEVNAVRDACKGTYTSPEDIEAALARMEVSGSPLEPFEVVFLGQYQVDQDKALHGRLEALLATPKPTQRMESNHD